MIDNKYIKTIVALADIVRDVDLENYLQKCEIERLTKELKEKKDLNK